VCERKKKQTKSHGMDIDSPMALGRVHQNPEEKATDWQMK